MEFSKFFINEYQLINVRSTTDRSKQMTIYGGISFTIFTLTILTLAYFEGQVSSIYGYLVSGLSVLLVYFYGKEMHLLKTILYLLLPDGYSAQEPFLLVYLGILDNT